MKRLIQLSFLAMLACSQPETADIYDQINEEVLLNSRAYGDLKEETSVIGHRLTGSENGARAEQYVYDKLVADSPMLSSRSLRLRPGAGRLSRQKLSLITKQQNLRL